MKLILAVLVPPEKGEHNLSKLRSFIFLQRTGLFKAASENRSYGLIGRHD